MIRLRPRRHGLLLLLLLTSCGETGTGDRATLPVPRDTYVRSMAELARLRRRPPPARGAPERERLADSARTEILTRHGVSAEDLVAFADVAGRDPTLMMEISQAIAELGDSMDAELAPGNPSETTQTLDRDSAPSESTGASSSRQDTSATGPPTTDPVPSPRFADPATDGALESEQPQENADSVTSTDRTPERPERRPIRRPARSRPER
ncbi:MAG: hypothetical protein M8835_08705 [marine benthic group bacterium]|nr:hypothetical protein [Gemmatimonadota bacterium]